jgi:hypothetical protein
MAAPSAPLPIERPVDVSIILESAGEEPREAVRYVLGAGARWKARTSVRTETSVEMEGEPAVTSAVPEAVLDLGYAHVGAEDDFTHLRRSISAVNFEPSPSMGKDDQAALAAFAEGMKGVTLVYGFSKQGTAGTPRSEGRGESEAPLAGLLDGLRAAVGQLGVPLPTEPIGRGAQWKVVGEVVVAGMKVDQESRFTLAELTPGKLRVTSTVTQTGHPGEVALPGAPPGVAASLLQLTGRGTGEHTVDPTSPVVLGSLVTETEVLVSIPMDEGHRKVKSKNRVQVTTTLPEAGAGDRSD